MDCLGSVLSEDDEDIEDDSSKQGRKLSDAEKQKWMKNKGHRLQGMKKLLDSGMKRKAKKSYVEANKVNLKIDWNDPSSNGIMLRYVNPKTFLRERGFAEDVDSISTMYPFVGLDEFVFEEKFSCIIKSSVEMAVTRTITDFGELLETFDRQDVIDLHSRVSFLVGINQWNALMMFSLAKLYLDITMSDSEDSTVTCTQVSSPFEDSSDVGSPGVDGPAVMPEDPYAYIVAAYQAPPSLDYMPGPKEP
ncbi:hypothetical protein Tco_1392149 [Tanacetum coccineum]